MIIKFETYQTATTIYTGQYMMTIDGVPAYEFFGPANGGPETILRKRYGRYSGCQRLVWFPSSNPSFLIAKFICLKKFLNPLGGSLQDLQDKFGRVWMDDTAEDNQRIENILNHVATVGISK